MITNIKDISVSVVTKAISDDSENGLFQTMLTISANDGAPELAGLNLVFQLLNIIRIHMQQCMKKPSSLYSTGTVCNPNSCGKCRILIKPKENYSSTC